MGMNKSKLMLYELDIMLMENFPLTAENLPNAYFIQCLWDLKTGGYMHQDHFMLLS